MADSNPHHPTLRPKRRAVFVGAALAVAAPGVVLSVFAHRLRRRPGRAKLRISSDQTLEQAQNQGALRIIGVLIFVAAMSAAVIKLRERIDASTDGLRSRRVRDRFYAWDDIDRLWRSVQTREERKSLPLLPWFLEPRRKVKYHSLTVASDGRSVALHTARDDASSIDRFIMAACDLRPPHLPTFQITPTSRQLPSTARDAANILLAGAMALILAANWVGAI